MKLVFDKFEAGTVRIVDVHSVGAAQRVADVHGHSEEETAARRPNAAAALFVAAPDLLDCLQAVVDQAEAQFKAGDRYASFSKNQIAQFKADLEKARR
jgi:hypothetical protein